MKYTVKVVSDKKMGNFWGMNRPAALWLKKHHKLGHTPIPPDNHTLFINSKRCSGKPKRRLLLHEKVEEHLMLEHGKSYPKAHKVANQFEWETFIKKKGSSHG